MWKFSFWQIYCVRIFDGLLYGWFGCGKEPLAPSKMDRDAIYGRNAKHYLRSALRLRLNQQKQLIFVMIFRECNMRRCVLRNGWNFKNIKIELGLELLKKTKL